MIKIQTFESLNVEFYRKQVSHVRSLYTAKLALMIINQGDNMLAELSSSEMVPDDYVVSFGDYYFSNVGKVVLKRKLRRREKTPYAKEVLCGIPFHMN